MKIVILDNYDSFTYNLVHLIEGIIEEPTDVFRNDKIGVKDIANYDALILSPGPGIPDDAGILKEVIRKYAGEIPILGVCLGMQAILEVFGGKLQNLEKVYHGVATLMKVIDANSLLFQGLPEEFEVGRYHSWIASYKDFPENELKITATAENDCIMAFEHKTKPIYAVQFHPESILTPNGKAILSNFLKSLQ